MVYFIPPILQKWIVVLEVRLQIMRRALEHLNMDLQENLLMNRRRPRRHGKPE